MKPSTLKEWKTLERKAVILSHTRYGAIYYGRVLAVIKSRLVLDPWFKKTPHGKWTKCKAHMEPLAWNFWRIKNVSLPVRPGVMDEFSLTQEVNFTDWTPTYHQDIADSIVESTSQFDPLTVPE